MTDLSPGARELVARVRAEQAPRPGDKERVWQAIGAATAIGAGAGAGALAAKTGGWASKLWWLAGAATVGAGVGVAALTVVWGGNATPPLAVEDAQEASSRSRLAPRGAPTVDAGEPGAEQPEQEGALEEGARREASSAEPRIERPLQAPPARKGDLTAELELLHQAHTAWRQGEPALALQLTERHTRRFPGSQLSAERTTLRVLALCALGREEEAARVAQRQLGLRAGAPPPAALRGSCVVPGRP